MIYLDYAATTPVAQEVADIMYQVLTEQFGNPSSQYRIGLEMKKQMELWRKTVADALDCDPGRLFFTSCGTEGDNWAITAALWHNRRLGRHIVTTAVEHSAVLEPCRWLERQGYELTVLSPDSQGNLTAEQVLEAVRPDTALVSMMLVNNELGNLYPIADIARGLAAKNPQTLLHTDAVQGFLKVPCSARNLGADFITLSAHKIGGPKGVGALYISPRVKLPKPLLAGGGQEGGGVRCTVACRHGLDGLLDELYTVADCGCGVLDVTVEHPVYGQLSGQLQVFSRYDADVFWDALQKNGAQPLCSLTGDIHLHTLVCPDEARKARVLAALEEKGYLMGLEK